VRLDFEAKAQHAQRAAQVRLAVEAVTARDDVQHFTPVRQADRTRGFHGALQIGHLDPPLGRHPRRPVAVDRLDVPARDRHEGAPDLVTAAALGLVDRRRDRSRQRVHIGDHPLAHPARWLDAQTQHVDVRVADLANQGAHLGGTDIDSYNQIAHYPPAQLFTPQNSIVGPVWVGHDNLARLYLRDNRFDDGVVIQ